MVAAISMQTTCLFSNALMTENYKKNVQKSLRRVRRYVFPFMCLSKAVRMRVAYSKCVNMATKTKQKRTTTHALFL